MRVLDLFSGRGGWALPFKKAGHEVVTVDINPKFECDITEDILKLDYKSLGYFDLILASPPCEAFSVASIGHHWTGGKQAYIPKTEHAKVSQELVNQTMRIIATLGPKYWIMENPRGVLRKLTAVNGLPLATVTYCQYGEKRMKPTDLWGKFPKCWTPRPMCKNGDPCHERAPRGAKTGTQGIKNAADRAVIPYELSQSILDAIMQEGTQKNLGGRDGRP